MEFFTFHLMPWPSLPEDFDRTYDSATVTFPNRYFQPDQIPALYNRYLDEQVLAERLGFDGLGLSEHHATPSSLSPSPNILAAALAQRTSRAKIALLGNAIPLRDNPLQVAEEIAMLDGLSNGRIISGFIRALGSEYYATGVNPTYSHERFHEALDLIVRAWTEPGPFSFAGKHFRYRYVNIWPKPVQQPHPPIYVPSGGDPGTTAWAAARGYPFMRSFAPVKALKPSFDEYRQRAQEAGREVPPEHLGWMAPIYVAESDARAVEEARPHLEFMFNQQHRRLPVFRTAPTYVVERSRGANLPTPAPLRHGSRTLETLIEDGIVVVGSGATVRDRLGEYCTYMGIGNLTAMMQFGSLPHELTVKNLHLFASAVMPSLRGLNATPVAARARPAAS